MLPLSVYGAVAMSHSDVSEEYSSPNQFFFYLYDKSYVSSSPVVLLLFSMEQMSIAAKLIQCISNMWQSGLGGLSFDEGQFSVFGYVFSTFAVI